MDNVILFPSGHYAIWAERLFQHHGICHKLIPVPRALSSDCGYCICLPTSAVEQAVSLLHRSGVDYLRVEPRPDKG
ncbi:DUF3343 domain-containing protein [Ferrimonas balearica]|uniref:DUF3343 domain-containing protein n=1 Tax=Ferrimonas balearica TaxID=44012 RepID=UPI001C970FD0|nr:DUF3343 domain-containing protein [Ferrimonas balearica]